VIRAVVDTSVLIRYLIRPSAAIKELIEVRWLGDQVQMVTAPELVKELEDVLKRDTIQALIQPQEGQALLDAIDLKAEILPPLGRIPSYTRDPKDDKFVACALAGDAGYVVTVDKDILVLGALSGIQMVTPEEFAKT
jgi:putative PIN family toxin of toxin-antitoxin system